MRIDVKRCATQQAQVWITSISRGLTSEDHYRTKIQIEILGETPVSAILNELARGDLLTALSHDNSGCGGQKTSLSRVLLLLFLENASPISDRNALRDPRDTLNLDVLRQVR